jgi:hypothetical protein
MLMAMRIEPPQMLEELNSMFHRKADAFAHRAPHEAEFIKTYRTRVSSHEALSCVESVGACQFGSTFESKQMVQYLLLEGGGEE